MSFVQRWNSFDQTRNEENFQVAKILIFSMTILTESLIKMSSGSRLPLSASLLNLSVSVIEVGKIFSTGESHSVRNAEVMSATGTLGTVVEAEKMVLKGRGYRLGRRRRNNEC